MFKLSVSEQLLCLHVCHSPLCDLVCCCTDTSFEDLLLLYVWYNLQMSSQIFDVQIM